MTAERSAFTADYIHIDRALRVRWPAFRALEDEMRAFLPASPESFQPQGEIELARLRSLNPRIPDEVLKSFVARQIELRSDSDLQFHLRFEESFMTEYVSVVVLSHALCEALINAVLALGLVKTNSSRLFVVLEKASIKDKWIVCPRTFVPTYEFPKGTKLYETLDRICKLRNALVHYKVEIEADGRTVMDGSRFERRPYAEEVKWLRRFFSLPYDLAEFSQNAIPGEPFALMFPRGEIDRAHDAARDQP
jgi:hypothetical protein